MDQVAAQALAAFRRMTGLMTPPALSVTARDD